MTTELWGVAYRRRCDGHHKNSLLLRPPAADATGPPTHPTPPRCARFGLRSAPAPGRIRPTIRERMSATGLSGGSGDDGARRI